MEFRWATDAKLWSRLLGLWAPGEQGGDFQGPLVLTEEWEGCRVVREACLLRLLAEASSERLNGRQTSRNSGWGDGAVIMTWIHRRKK